jgi:hypothetical protein
MFKTEEERQQAEELLKEGRKVLEILPLMSACVTRNDLDVMRYKIRHEDEQQDDDRIKMTNPPE